MRRRPGGLTDREIEVLRLLARGLTNKEIATALDISSKTAGHHVQHVLEQLYPDLVEAVDDRELEAILSLAITPLA